MPQLALILLHVSQLVLLPFIALSGLLAAREQLPFGEGSAWWWVVLLGLVTAVFSGFSTSWKVGFFDAQRFGAKLFVDRKATREFLMMAVAPVAWLLLAAAQGPKAYLDAVREAGVLVFTCQHLVMAVLLLLHEVKRALAEGPGEELGAMLVVLAARTAFAAVLGFIGALLLWVWVRQLSGAWLGLFAVTAVGELAGSVPWYRRHLKEIFAL